ncbi:hypothetical protein [Arthrobacter sp. NPDC056493]|uniref:hypothetical protein n=1 Tax=Arthrobacter sp. NPDC056493 TaxID=3345839 RepID=UPI00366BEFF8
MSAYEDVVEERRPGGSASTSTGLKVESLGAFQDKITIMVDIYARLHLKARFFSRTLLLVTLGFSAISAGMNLMTLWLDQPSQEVQILLRAATILSLVLVLGSLASTIWGLDQRASECNYAFRRLMSIKTKLRVASVEEARRMQRDYAEFGDDLPQISTREFTKLWNAVLRERDARKARDAKRAGKNTNSSHS